jgi:hypothetical protein
MLWQCKSGQNYLIRNRRGKECGFSAFHLYGLKVNFDRD